VLLEVLEVLAVEVLVEVTETERAVLPIQVEEVEVLVNQEILP
jgi:hypothetical protein